MSPRLGLPGLRHKSASSPDPVAAAAGDIAAINSTSAPAIDPETLATSKHAAAAPAEPADAEKPDATGAPAATSPAHGLALLAEYTRAILSWVQEDGYPVNAHIEIEVRPDDGVVLFTGPAGFQVPPGAVVALTGSHIRVLSGGGFDQRSHVTLWGGPSTRPRGRVGRGPSRDGSCAGTGSTRPRRPPYDRPVQRRPLFGGALPEERGEPIRPRV